jgi:hypothetical protein
MPQPSSTPARKNRFRNTQPLNPYREITRLVGMHAPQPYGEHAVMAFYQEVGRKDEFRKKMLKTAVLSIDEMVRDGVNDPATMTDTYRAIAGYEAEGMTLKQLRKWWRCNPRRKGFFEPMDGEKEILAHGYVKESLQVFGHVLDFVRVLG